MLLFHEKAGLYTDRTKRIYVGFEVVAAVNTEIWRHVVWKTSTDITKEFASSTFGVRDEGNRFLSNVGTCLPDNTELLP
jgi:hypothetical protein